MRRLPLVFALATSSCLAISADKEVEDLLKAMRVAYQSVATAKLSTETDLAQGGNKMRMKIELQFARPNKLRAKVTSGDESPVTIVSTGTQIIAKEGGAEARSRSMAYDLDRLGQMLPANLETLNFFDWKRQLSTAEGGNMKTSTFKIVKGESWNGKTWTVLEETAPTQGVFVRYWIDPKTNLMWRTLAKRTNSKEPFMDARLLSLELGVKLPPDVFAVPK